jgi:hypothetical protein
MWLLIVGPNVTIAYSTDRERGNSPTLRRYTAALPGFRARSANRQRFKLLTEWGARHRSRSKGRRIDIVGVQRGLAYDRIRPMTR